MKQLLSDAIDDYCEVWPKAINTSGYGTVWHEGKNRLAHRVAYETAVGPIPEGLELDHLCRVRACVNPAHLEPVTHAENMRRARAAVTHCPHGHEYTPENTFFTKPRERLGRSCKTCKANLQRRRRGSRRWNLSTAQRNEIQALLSAGLTQRAVGLRVGVSQKTVWRVANEAVAE